MLTKFAKPHEKSHEKNLNCFERYDALFQIKNNFQILVLGTPEVYPALDPFNFIKVDSKFGIMTQSNLHTWDKLFCGNIRFTSQLYPNNELTVFQKNCMKW